jgi:hypothetical protein
VIHWIAQQLDAKQREAIAHWPPTYELDIAELGHTLFCHATPDRIASSERHTSWVEALRGNGGAKVANA